MDSQKSSDSVSLDSEKSEDKSKSNMVMCCKKVQEKEEDPENVLDK